MSEPLPVVEPEREQASEPALPEASADSLASACASASASVSASSSADASAEARADIDADADLAEEEAEAQPAPLGVARTPTGNADVDAQLDRLADADHLPADGHLAVYEDVHRGLRDALTALDTRPGPA